MSQLDLALTANVSARHISFIETGKTHPTREMLIDLADALGLSIPERNTLLISADYAPEHTLKEDSNELNLMELMCIQIADKMAPYPAYVIDEQFWVKYINEGVHHILDVLNGPQERVFRHLVEIFPEYQPFITNWPEVMAFTWDRMREFASSTFNPYVDAFISSWEMPSKASAKTGEQVSMFVPLEFLIEGHRIDMVLAVISLGGPIDFVPDNWRILICFPKDDASKATFHSLFAPTS